MGTHAHKKVFAEMSLDWQLGSDLYNYLERIQRRGHGTQDDIQSRSQRRFAYSVLHNARRVLKHRPPRTVSVYASFANRGEEACYLSSDATCGCRVYPEACVRRSAGKRWHASTPACFQRTGTIGPTFIPPRSAN